MDLFGTTGASRNAWLEDQESKLADTLSHYLAPTGILERLGLANQVLNPVVGIRDAGTQAQAVSQGDMGAIVPMITEMAGAVAPVAAGKIAGKTADDVANAVIDTFTGINMTPEAQQAYRFMQDEAGAVKLPGRGKRSTDLPNLRGLDVDEATRIARSNPHLIPAGEGSDSIYVGAPRNVQSRQDLTNIRRNADKAVARGAEGGDWYDRYREGVQEVTGLRGPGSNLPGQEQAAMDADWMTAQHGQFSAGVSPESELGFTLKDLNSGLATGTPVKAARPAQQLATMRALESRDPLRFQLGPKTGEYARRVNPATAGENTATGVNDFRHARTLGFTEPDGSPQGGAIGPASHRWSDFETALMVDRANKRGLAGRSDWTGEQIQAAPWVAQKADDFFGRQRNGYLQKAKERLMAAGSNDFSPENLEFVGKEIAFEEANRTITDFFPKHTAYGTYEAQPFVDSGQLPGLASATPEQRLAFFDDTRSSWTGEDGRDVIYSGYREPGTGYAMRVRPSIGAQGLYTPPGGVTEANPAGVARPLLAFDSTKGGHVTPEADRALMDAAEATRAMIDVQGAGAWHKPWSNAKVGERNMARLSFGEDVPQMTADDLVAMGEIGGRYGVPDVVDTGDGVTLANFMGDQVQLGAKDLRALDNDLIAGGYNSTVVPGRMDSGYIGYEDAWRAGEGSGQVVNQFLDMMDGMPASTVQKLDANVEIPKAALARIERDADWAKTMGATRQDVENMRRIIGQGPGWVGRLREAAAAGTVLPALAAAMITGSGEAPPSDKTGGRGGA